MEIAAGEYGYNARRFPRLLRGRSVDVLQADATRCGGVTGFLQVAALCEAHHIDLSGHCAPGAASACRLRRAAAAPSRMVSRPCADRAHAVRRRAGSPTTARSRPICRARARPRLQRARRRALPRRMIAMAQMPTSLGVAALLAPGRAAQWRAEAARSAASRATGPSLTRVRRRALDQREPRQLNRASALLALARVWPTARSSIIAARSRTRPCTCRSPCRR